MKIVKKSLLFVVTFIVLYYLFYTYLNADTSSCGTYSLGQISVGGVSTVVELADNDCKRALGLSGRTSLGENRGMIFIYKEEGVREIWMKDMKFPLDILWIDKDMKIVGIEKSVQPISFPEKFGGKFVSKSVLELPVGFSDKNKVSLGGAVYLID